MDRAQLVLTDDTSNPDVASAGDWYADRLCDLQSKSDPNEADVTDAVVRPLLERILGYSVQEIDAQPTGRDLTGRQRRPDFICSAGGSAQAAVIVEVKALGKDLISRASPNAPIESAPLGQLEDYLRRHRQSGDGTWGLVTNGIEWIITRRDGEDVLPFSQTLTVEIRSSIDADKALAELIASPKPKWKATPADDASDWLEAVTECESPKDFLARLVPVDHEVRDDSAIQSAAGETIAHVRSGMLWPGMDMFPQEVFVACLRLDYFDGLLSPADIAQKLDELDTFVGQAVAGVAYTNSGADGIRKCRGFVRTEGHLFATALIDPWLPGSRAARQFEVLSRGWSAEKPEEIIEALSSTPLQRQFHEQVGAWFETTREETNELRHLIRVMFAWLLQERGVLPQNALWDTTYIPKSEHEIHEHVNWLFTNVLAVPSDMRKLPADLHPWQRALVDTAPFLNGSLFSGLDVHEKPENFTNEQYIGRGGLLTILRRFDWTLHDRTGLVSESALDPALLGDMFEQLILRTEGIRIEGASYLHHKMPDGTYYTPQDVAEEMVADAIAGWLAPKIDGLKWREARDLAHSAPQGQCWLQWTPKRRENAARLLRNLTALDPCCGSGAFTLAMLHALWRAARRLASGVDTVDWRALERIIENQLNAVDIHPMAVLITRLRLFIALVDARSRYSSDELSKIAPLPNLETKCMVADTLCIDLHAQEAFRNEDWDSGIEDLRAARALWTTAHHPDEKDIALRTERNARAALVSMSAGWNADSDLEWLEADFLSASAPPARFDIRRLFPAPPGGWDIVIGNPPYQKPNQEDKTRGERLGYKGYKGNLYLMFIEAAINVAANGGCVTMVVPHSIVFRRQAAFSNVRRTMESLGESVILRTYDNMPKPLFPPLPWLKPSKHGQQNRQRATILTFRKAAHTASRATVFSNGLIRHSATNRGVAIGHSPPGQPQPPWETQWTQAPTDELVKLLRAMRREMHVRHRAPSDQTTSVTFPPTAMYFVSCLRPQDLENPGRKQWHIPKGPLYWPWLGLFNSNLFHTYWLMIGDAFHLNPATECGSVRAPPGWEDEELRQATENATRALFRDALEPCRVVKNNKGPQHNVNFHKEGTPGPAAIQLLDELLLDAYRLPREPLLTQMQIIRTGSAHQLDR